MTEKTLSGLAATAIDNHSQICALQSLLEIAQEQAANIDPKSAKLSKTMERMKLLINCYLSYSDNHLEQLKYCLERMRQMIQ